jgi:catechol 2,3-dioxygenase-like lactoylglutathione lyase family enzyme
MIKQIAHICIGATDLAASERFYCEVLGMSKKFRFIRKGEEFGFYLDAGNGNYIEVFSQDAVEEGKKPVLKHFCLEVDDINAAVQRIAAAGVPVTEKMMGADHSWQAWITDPAGARIELHEYTPASTQLTGVDCVVDW